MEQQGIDHLVRKDMLCNELILKAEVVRERHLNDFYIIFLTSSFGHGFSIKILNRSASDFSFCSQISCFP
jgi:hypothetical protein